MHDKWMFIAIFSGVWGLVGVVFYIIGAFMLTHRRRKERTCTARAYGVVTDLVRRESRDSDGNYSASWHPVFEYHIGDLTFIKESSFGSSQAKFAVGERVDVFYDPEDYNRFYVPQESTPNLISKVFIAVGTVAIMIAVIAAVVVSRTF